MLQRQEDTHRNKVCKFKLYYSSKFRVLRSTKISNTFLYNSKPRDVIKLGLPVCTCTLTTLPLSFVYTESLTYVRMLLALVNSKVITNLTCIPENMGHGPTGTSSEVQYRYSLCLRRTWAANEFAFVYVFGQTLIPQFTWKCGSFTCLEL